MTDKPNYKCEKEGKCKVTKETRKDCSACRLERCRSVGMEGNSILVYIFVTLKVSRHWKAQSVA